MRTQIPGKQILDEGVDTADLNDGAVTDEKLSTTGVAGGSYTKVTVNDKGRVTDAENPTTLAGYGITDGVAVDDARFDVSLITTDDEASRPNARQLIGTTGEVSVTDNGAGSTVQVGIPDNPVFPGTGALILTKGTTAQRPTGAEGMVRYNTTDDDYEVYSESATEWEAIVTNGDLRLNPTNRLNVRVNPGPGEFASVKAAIDSITGNTASNRFLVDVGPGVFTENNPIQMKPWVGVIAHSWQATVIAAANANEHLLLACNDSMIMDALLTGATGTDKAAIYFEDAVENVSTKSFSAFNIRFGANYNHARVVSSTKTTFIQLVAPVIGGSYPYVQGLVAISTAGGVSRISARLSTTIGATSPEPTDLSYASGAGAEMYLNNLQVRTSLSSPSGTGVRLRNGALGRIISGAFRGFAKAVWIENNGAASTILGYNLACESNTQDVVIDHPTAVGAVYGALTSSKVVSASSNVSLLFLDPSTGASKGTNVVGHLNIGQTQSLLTDVTPSILESGPIGILSGGELSAHPTLPATMVVAAGYGYIRDATTQKLKYIAWATTNVELIDNSPNTIYIDTNGVFHADIADPNQYNNIIFGGALSFGGTVGFIARTPLKADNAATHLDDYLRVVFGPIFASGSLVMESAGSPYKLDITSGEYYFSRIKFTPSGGNEIYFLEFQPDGTFTPTDTVNHTDYNNAGTLTPLTAGYYTKHALYAFEDGADEVYGFVFGQTEHATELSAEFSPNPTPPPFFVVPVVLIATIVVQEGASNIVTILDERPRLGFTAAAASAVADHGNLAGLGDDDHPQYLLATGTRALSGPLNLNTNNITNVGTLNGINVDTHASRHQPNGADPLSTAAAISIGPSSTNTTGTSNSLARADHTHLIAGFQPLSDELTSAAAISTTGLVSHIEPNAWATRIITSSGGALTITNPGGVAGDIDINFAPVGTPGTYYAVTTDVNGSVISGTQQVPFSALTGLPSTLAGHGITDAQPLDSDLSALASMGTTGIYIRTGTGTSVTRSLTAPAAGLTITNPDGLAGSPTFALANDLGAIEALASNGIPVRTGTDTWAIRSLTAPAAGITITNPAGTAGNPTFALAGDLAQVEALATTGFAVRSANTPTWVTRSFSSTNLTITNGDGIAGNPTIVMPNVGSAGTYTQVTTDAVGRVITGANPTTLAGYGITDAINTSEKGAANGVATLDSGGKLLTTQLPSLAITDSYVVANEAAMLALVAEVGDIAIRTDVSETYILQALPASTLSNWKKLATPTDTVTSVNGQTGVVSLSFVTSVGATQPAAGLTISGSPITSTGTLTFALANDLAALEGLGSTGFAVRTAADTWVQRNIAGGTGIGVTNGDGVAGAPTISLTSVGSAGTYRSVTTDAQGRVTAGTNPTTLAGYAISDAQPLDSDLTALAATATTGLYTITGVGTSATRSIIAGTGISVTNGTGVAGNITIANTGVLGITETAPAAGFSITTGGTAANPIYTFALTNDLAALEGLASTGFAVRTATDTWAQRSIAVGTGLSISNASGVAGNPTISLAGTSSAASALLSSWTLVSGSRYYSDFVHNLGTNNIVLTLYDTADNSIVNADSVVLTDTNTARVTVIDNTRTLRAVAVANGNAINTATQSAGTITTAKDGVNVSAAASRLNFTGQAVSVVDAGSGTTNVMVGSRFTHFATSLDTPTTSDWAINAFAPSVVDPTFSSLTARQFSNTTEQGVGLLISIPTGATSATFRFRGRPQTSIAGATNVVGMRVYARAVTGTMTAGAGGWQAVKEIGEMPVPASSVAIVSSAFTISLATLSLTSGNLYQFELTRRVSGTTGTNIATNYLLYEVSVELS